MNKTKMQLLKHLIAQYKLSLLTIPFNILKSNLKSMTIHFSLLSGHKALLKICGRYSYKPKAACDSYI